MSSLESAKKDEESFSSTAKPTPSPAPSLAPSDSLPRAPRRWKPSLQAKSLLLAAYKEKLYPDGSVYRQLATEIGATVAQVQAWFRNQRQRDKHVLSMYLQHGQGMPNMAHYGTCRAGGLAGASQAGCGQRICAGQASDPNISSSSQSPQVQHGEMHWNQFPSWHGFSVSANEAHGRAQYAYRPQTQFEVQEAKQRAAWQQSQLQPTSAAMHMQPLPSGAQQFPFPADGQYHGPPITQQIVPNSVGGPPGTFQSCLQEATSRQSVSQITLQPWPASSKVMSPLQLQQCQQQQTPAPPFHQQLANQQMHAHMQKQMQMQSQMHAHMMSQMQMQQMQRGPPTSMQQLQQTDKIHQQI
mmetsp:Transcript_536/g.1123  ORF Transcript_536/g.1123 Transcript_536/m.1123 type:complete len:355 (-) Transcript_536:568-1632(-)